MKFLLAVFFLFGALPAHGEEIRVAAASDLNFAIHELIQQFERETGHKVSLTLGSSGSFYGQIANGAPFDIFLSADMNYPKELEKSGVAIPGSTFSYGVGAIAIWVPKGSSIKIESLGMNSLVDSSIRKIAIANPDHAPYGRAAVAAMQAAGVYERVKNKLVRGENISQAAQFVQSRAADIGIIALSIATSEPMQKSGRYWPIPSDMHPRLEQGAALLKRAGPAARMFHEWLRGPQARKIFSKYGFGQR